MTRCFIEFHVRLTFKQLHPITLMHNNNIITFI